MTHPAISHETLEQTKADQALELERRTNPDNLIVWPGRRCSALAFGSPPGPAS